jgi:hypothetical protein
MMMVPVTGGVFQFQSGMEMREQRSFDPGD